jgi:predicted O-linked N-acetylglucosamine transferase (SPINDLY family)
MINNYLKNPEFINIIDLIHKRRFLEANTKLDILILKDKNNFLLNNLKGVILLNLNELDNAEFFLKKSINLNKNFIEAYSNLGIVFFLKKNFLDSIKNFENCLATGEKLDFYYLNIANCYRELNNFNNSLKFYFLALEKNNNNFEIFFNLGILYLSVPKNFDKAIEFFKKTIDIKKDHYLSYFFLGRCYNLKKEFEDAIFFLKKSILINPNYYKSYEELSYSYYAIKDFKECVNSARSSLKLNPKSIKSYLREFSALQSLGKPEESYPALFKALKLNKNNNEIWNNFGVIAQSKGNFFKAKKYYKRSLKILESSNTLKNIGHCFFETHDQQRGFEYIGKAITLPSSSIDDFESYMFHSNYLLDHSQKEYLLFCKKYRSKIIINNLNFFSSIDRSYHIQNSNVNKLKVGFISGDFNHHAVATQITDIFSEISKSQKIELFAYYNNHKIDNDTKEFINLIKNWKNILSLSDKDVVKTITEDNLNILIDLSGHTSGSRLPVFIAKPAPIQMSWCGYLQSLGLSEIDYIIADKFTIPVDFEELYLEKIIRLPNVWSNLSLSKINNIPSKITPAIKNKYITFGSFNHSKKINNKVIKTWSSILNSLPNSKLIIHLGTGYYDERFIYNFKNFFFKNRVNENQLIINTNRKDRKTLLDCYNEIDISLDTFPYSGGTTSLESIAMCVPIVTLYGSLFLSRTGYSVNMNSGLNDWCCKNEEEYIKKTIYFASNIEKLNNIRLNLYNNKKNNPIFNSKIFAQDFISALENAWNNYKINKK